jgi:hypothetical protein
MKKLIAIWMALLPFAIHAFPLKGKITDAKTGQGIPGAALIVPELKIVSICNAEGEFSSPNCPVKNLSFRPEPWDLKPS